MAFRAAIFDMDGTILDTLEDLRDSVNVSLRRAGFPERSLDEVRSFVGSGARMLIRRAVPAGTDGETIQRVLDFYRPYYEAHARIKTAPYPGIFEMLKTLKSAGMKLAVVSNKPDPAVKQLAAHFFPGLFDAAVGARDGVPVKPAPNLVLETLALLETDPEEAVYIGDSDVDVVTAKNTGTAGIAVCWGFREEAFLRACGAEQIAHDAGELTGFLLGEQ